MHKRVKTRTKFFSVWKKKLVIFLEDSSLSISFFFFFCHFSKVAFLDASRFRNVLFYYGCLDKFEVGKKLDLLIEDAQIWDGKNGSAGEKDFYKTH